MYIVVVLYGCREDLDMPLSLCPSVGGLLVDIWLLGSLVWSYLSIVGTMRCVVIKINIKCPCNLKVLFGSCSCVASYFSCSGN